MKDALTVGLIAGACAAGAVILVDALDLDKKKLNQLANSLVPKALAAVPALIKEKS